MSKLINLNHEVDLAHFRGNPEFADALQDYPLARLVVNSAALVEPHDGYHRLSCFSAYRDWILAIIGQQNVAYWHIVHGIEELLPPDADEQDLEDTTVPPIRSDNPVLPGLPARPEVRAQQARWAMMRAMLEETRWAMMRAMLEETP